MPYRALVVFTRKPDESPAVFEKHFEQDIINIIKNNAGDTFPTSHTRMYVKRSEEPGYPADIIVGEQEDFPFDGISIIEFEDEAAAKRFMAKIEVPEARKTMEGKLGVPIHSKGRAVLLSGTYTTTKDWAGEKLCWSIL